MASYDNALIVLARGGSKGLPGKNMSTVGGETLIERAVRIALESNCFERVIVSSDDQSILAAAHSAGSEPHHRTTEMSDDYATSEDSLLEVIKDCEVLNKKCYLRQCTTPFISKNDLINIRNLADKYPCDTVVSGYLENVHHWLQDIKKIGLDPLSDSSEVRLPRQSNSIKIFVENGGVYVFPREQFLQSRNRFIGKVIPYVMSKWHSIDIDVYDDLMVAQELSKLF